MNENNDILVRNLKQNEISTNKLVCLVSLSFIIIFLFNEFSLKVRYSQGLAIVDQYIILPCCIFEIFLIVLSFYIKFEKPWLKFLLIWGIVFICSVSFFLFTTYASYFLLVPIVVSSRYFNKKLSVFVIIITILLFLISCILNVFLDDKSDLLYLMHQVASYDSWKDPIDAFTYIVVPITLTLLFIGLYCISITSKGTKLIINQSEEYNKNSLYESELRYAGKIQADTLPKDSFVSPDGNFEIYAGQIAAKEVCGDSFDYFMLNDHTLVFIVADVADKGLSAAMFMMSTRKAIKCALQCSDSLKEAIDLTNRLVCNDNPNNMFVTFWMGVIDTISGIGQFVNAGHLPPIIKHIDGSYEIITNEPDLFMGNFPDMPPRVYKLYMNKGDVLLLYTDGITDARNIDGLDFSSNGVISVVNNCNNDAKEVRDSVIKAVTDFSGSVNQFDDMTLMAIKCNDTKAPCKMTIQNEADIAGIKKIINAVDELLRSIYCPDESRRNIEIVVDEICNNISEYAYGNKRGIIYLDITFGNNYIDFVFRDNGIPFNPLCVPEPIENDEIKVGGWGIYFSKKLSNEMSYQYINNQNTLTIRFLWNILKNS